MEPRAQAAALWQSYVEEIALLLESADLDFLSREGLAFGDLFQVKDARVLEQIRFATKSLPLTGSRRWGLTAQRGR